MSSTYEAFFLFENELACSIFVPAFFDQCQVLRIRGEPDAPGHVELYGTENTNEGRLHEPSSPKEAVATLSSWASGGCIEIYNDQLYDGVLSFLVGQNGTCRVLLLQYSNKVSWLEFAKVVMACASQVESIRQCYAGCELGSRMNIVSHYYSCVDNLVENLNIENLSFGDLGEFIAFNKGV